MLSIAIHSHKGGVGKTTIGVNMAMLLAQAGKNVCLVDFDFGGPNLFTFFNQINVTYLNEYFWKEKNVDECIYNLKDDYNLEGNFFVCLADPSSESITATLELDSVAAMKMLQDAMKLKNILRKKPYEVDFLIFDNTPGLGVINVNSFLVTDTILFLIKFSNSDINGTVHLISGLIDVLNNETAIIANNIPPEHLVDESKVRDNEKLLVSKIKEQTGVDINFLGWLPTDKELQSVEYLNAVENLRGADTQRVIHAISLPDHPMMMNLRKVIEKLL